MAIVEQNMVKFTEHSETLINNLNFLHSKNMFLDLCLIFHGTELYAHKAVLAAASPFFRDRICEFGEYQARIYLETEVNGISVNVEDIRLLIQFIYKGNVYVPEERIPYFLEIGNYFQVFGLCKEVLHTDNFCFPLIGQHNSFSSNQQFIGQNLGSFQSSFHSEMNEIQNNFHFLDLPCSITGTSPEKISGKSIKSTKTLHIPESDVALIDLCANNSANETQNNIDINPSLTNSPTNYDKFLKLDKFLQRPNSESQFVDLSNSNITSVNDTVSDVHFVTDSQSNFSPDNISTKSVKLSNKSLQTPHSTATYIDLCPDNSNMDALAASSERNFHMNIEDINPKLSYDLSIYNNSETTIDVDDITPIGESHSFPLDFSGANLHPESPRNFCFERNSLRTSETDVILSSIVQQQSWNYSSVGVASPGGFSDLGFIPCRIPSSTSNNASSDRHQVRLKVKDSIGGVSLQDTSQCESGAASRVAEVSVDNHNNECSNLSKGKLKSLQSNNPVFSKENVVSTSNLGKGLQITEGILQKLPIEEKQSENSKNNVQKNADSLSEENKEASTLTVCELKELNKNVTCTEEKTRNEVKLMDETLTKDKSISTDEHKSLHITDERSLVEIVAEVLTLDAESSWDENNSNNGLNRAISPTACNTSGDLPLLNTEDMGFTCSKCLKIFTTNNDKDVHMFDEHGIGKVFQCLICSYKTFNESELVEHGREHLDSEDHKCCICGNKYKTKTTLKNHMTSHSPNNWLKCSKCSAQYVNKNSLIKHLAVHHKVNADGHPFPKENYTCCYCTYSTWAPHRLKDHMTRSHTKGKSFKCSYCDYATSVKLALVKHIRVHTKERPYNCTVCELSFVTTSTLKRHERSHSKTRPFECEQCGQKYADKKRLKEHIYKHKSIKPFSCTYCRYTSTRKDNLISHIRRNHANAKGEIPKFVKDVPVPPL